MTAGPVPHASASGFSGLTIFGRPDYNEAATVEITNDRPWPPRQDTTDFDGASPRQRLSRAHSHLSPSATCEQDSPQVLAHSVVAHSDLTEVIDLLAMYAGVASTTPADILAWPIPLTTTSSATGFEVHELLLFQLQLRDSATRSEAQLPLRDTCLQSLL